MLFCISSKLLFFLHFYVYSTYYVCSIYVFQNKTTLKPYFTAILQISNNKIQLFIALCCDLNKIQQIVISNNIIIDVNIFAEFTVAGQTLRDHFAKKHMQYSKIFGLLSMYLCIKMLSLQI